MAVVYSQNGVIVKPKKNDYTVIGDKKYKTVIMPDGKEWLAENLDFRMSSTDSYYNNDETTYGWNGRKYGLLYNRTSCQAIYDYFNRFYPEWRLPTEEDYNTLITSVNNDVSLLKSSLYWNTPGTDNYGFNAMPTGYYDENDRVLYDMNFTTFIKLQSNRANFLYIEENNMSIANWQAPIFASIRLVRDAT